MTRRKRKAARAPTHVSRCVKQTIPYAPSTSESLTWHAQQSDRAYNQTVRTALDALAKGQGLPRVAYADKDKGTPPGDSLLKRLTAWRAEESCRAAPARAHDVPLTTAAGALAPLTGPWGLAIATVAVIVIVVAYTRRTR